MHLPQSPGNPVAPGTEIIYWVRVDPKGKPIAAWIHQAPPGIAPPLLWETRKQILQSRRWTIALDEAGKPVTKHWEVRFRWLRPEEKRTPPILDP